MACLRWLVDAPNGSHWILSERVFENQARELLSSNLKIEYWSPDVLSRWIGEAVLRGEIVAKIPQIEVNETQIEDNSSLPKPNKLVILPAIVDLDVGCIILRFGELFRICSES